MGNSIAIPGFNAASLLPGVFIALDGSQANTAQRAKRALLIGQVNNPNGYPQNLPVLAGTIQDVRAACGRGSILTLMYDAFRAVDPDTEVWLLPLFDDGASQKAAGLLSLSGTATGAGTLSVYMAGRLLPVAVSVGQTAAQILQALSVPTNNSPNLPATFSQLTTTGSTSTATMTAINGGALGNDIDLRLDYLGQAGGESLPAGLSSAITSFSGGSQNPGTLAAALAACGDMPFDFICCPYTDAASLNAIQAFLNAQSGRWSIGRQIYGHAFSAFRGTGAQRQTFAATRNDPHASILGFYDSPTTSWEWAAMLTAAFAVSVQEDPALPVKGIVLPALAPPIGSRDSASLRETLLDTGMGTFTVDPSGQVVLERVPTTYTTNPATGAPDNSFRDTETLFTAAACLEDMRIQLASQFARRKLVADGTPIQGGSNMVTAQTVLAAAKARYRTQATVFGWCQNPDDFNRQARAQNAGNGRVNLFLPYQFANQLWQIAGNCQFTKP